MALFLWRHPQKLADKYVRDCLSKDLKDIKGAVELQVREKAARMLECAPPSDAFRQAIDTCVLVPLVQTVAEQLHAKFQDRIIENLPGAVPRSSFTEELPEGWTRVWSSSKQAHYFYNANSGESTWSRPSEQHELGQQHFRRQQECW